MILAGGDLTKKLNQVVFAFEPAAESAVLTGFHGVMIVGMKWEGGERGFLTRINLRRVGVRAGADARAGSPHHGMCGLG